MNRRWICGDVWMDILPLFNRVELCLTMALLSDRFDALVDAHFDGQSELTIWRLIKIYKDIAEPKAKLSFNIGFKSVEFPLPDRPLPNKICFRFLRIAYIDHSVIGFLHFNQQIFDKGTNLYLHLKSYKTGSNVQPIWDVFVRQIWPVFTTTNFHHLGFDNADHLDTLLRLTSPTILSDMNINSIESGRLFLEAIGDDDGPNATQTAGQVLSKWLHIPRTNGQPKKLRCAYTLLPPPNLEWITNFKETFLCATVSVSYIMSFVLDGSTPIEQFELENERTKEKLTMEKATILDWDIRWLMKRCPINVETAAIQWENENLPDKLNNVQFVLDIDTNCIGPLSPPAEEKADE